MAHEILGTRFVSLEQPGWHKIGRTFDVENPTSIVDGISEVAQGIEIVKKPMFSKFKHEGQTFQVKAVDADGKQTFGIWRLPTLDDPRPVFFGTAKKDWAVRQFPEYAANLAPLQDAFNLTTAGILQEGRRLMVSMAAEPFDADFGNGYLEKINNYFVVDISNTPGRAHQLLYTPVRVVCMNTLSMGADAASIKVNLQHSADVGKGVELIAEMAAAMITQAEATKALFERMGRQPLGNTDVEHVLAKVYPLKKKPAKVALLDKLTGEQIAEMIEGGVGAINKIQKAETSWKAANVRQENMRAVTVQLLNKFNDEFPQVANTSWALYQAITEHADHREGRSNEAVGESILYGNRAKEKAAGWYACKALLPEMN